MDEEVVVAACSAIIIASTVTRKKKKRKSREAWAKRWLVARDSKSAYNTTIQEFRMNDKENFRLYLRMNTETFDELALLVTPMVQKQYTRLRKPIGVVENLACTLRYLVSRELFASLQYLHTNSVYRKQQFPFSFPKSVLQYLRC